jgi:hypothetical protein
VSAHEIRHRSTRAVLWSDEAESVLDAIAQAVAAGADLTGADLARANLTGADLTGANLTDANLTDANLARANLTDANLTDANLARANLTDANLAGADLTGANLTDAYLARANLTGANLTDAYLARANLTGANLTDARHKPASLADHQDPSQPYERPQGALTRQEHAARYRERHPDVPVVEHLDARILAAVDSGGSLEMSRWHVCETTHCRAGWAVHLAGEAGYALERKLGAECAGRAIYRASTGRAPYFFASTEEALEDLRRCAAEDAEG